MNDEEFDQLIDCRFPYRDEPEWKRLTDLGRSISPNAHFITLGEICRPPRSAKVTAAQQTRMMHYWAEGFEHPLTAVALECATARFEAIKALWWGNGEAGG